ncbi:septal ring lytic transglycosylase RlpA family protein [Proteinivorax tanatarense]|uniref:Probable endolytic peptidoglycan transglycosylase RlpA n=1 Tax=Proteinivorax tanatarense TaxID=1260629 RepID=A0AAU7VPW2_9FIRM
MILKKIFGMTVVFLLLLIGIGTVFSQNYTEVTIFKDNEVFTVNTQEKRVGEILKESEMDINEYHKVYPDKSELLESKYIYIETGSKVTIDVDGEQKEIISWEPNIESLLFSQRIELGDKDILSLDKGTELEDGLKVDITRVTKETVVEEEEVGFETEHVDNSNLLSGSTEVKNEGNKGVRKITYEHIFHDGEKVSSKKIDDEIVKEPKNQIVYVGTKEEQVASSNSSRDDRAPQASRGRTEETSGEVFTGKASYYGSELHGQLTASEEVFDKNKFTAAHPTLEFGTVVRVTLKSTGRSVDVRINDRGPHVPGIMIDLSKAAASEIGLVGPGIGEVKVEVIK